MQFVQPEVYLISKTRVNWPEILRFLADIGAEKWRPGEESDSESLMEIAGRLCYNSYEPGLNPNVNKIRVGNESYLRHILESDHSSVLEHATVGFIFRNVSRIFTHELVRHRVGVAISQESMRYVRVQDLKFYMPDCIHDSEEISSWREVIQYLQDFYLEKTAHLDGEKRFSVKKLVTSALRRLLPGGVCTTIMWTANFNILRHVILKRTSLGAEEEIRKVFDQVALLMKTEYPHVFQDFHRTEDGEWIRGI